MKSEVEPTYLRGTWRLMWYEHWQKLGVSNTYQLTREQRLDIPRSIKNMRMLIEDSVGESVCLDWLFDIEADYNGGHRA